MNKIKFDIPTIPVPDYPVIPYTAGPTNPMFDLSSKLGYTTIEKDLIDQKDPITINPADINQSLPDYKYEYPGGINLATGIYGAMNMLNNSLLKSNNPNNNPDNYLSQNMFGVSGRIKGNGSFAKGGTFLPTEELIDLQIERPVSKLTQYEPPIQESPKMSTQPAANSDSAGGDFNLYMKHQQGESGWNQISKAAQSGSDVKSSIFNNMKSNVHADFWKSYDKLTPQTFTSYWKNKFNESYKIANSKVTPLDDIFNEAAKTTGLSPQFLKAVAYTESSFDPNANKGNNRSYKGVMQINHREFKGNNIYDPRENIMFGAKRLAAMNTRFTSSGKYGTQNIGEHGMKIINYITDNLSYKPEFNSIYRDNDQQKELNRSGVGAKRSWHERGDAVDLKPKDWNNLPTTARNTIKKNYDVIFHNNHYHIEPKGKMYEEGGEYKVTDEELEYLKSNGYTFEIL